MSKSTLLSVLMLGSMAMYGHNEPVISPAPDPKFLNVKVYLEGAYDGVSAKMNTELTAGAVVPLAQPYNVAPWNYTGTESVTAVPGGAVDWVLVELRDAATPADAILGYNLPGWPKAYLLLSDGSIVDLDGTSQPNIGSPTISNSLFVVVRHRNHLAVLSSAGATLVGDVYSYDFTTGLSQAYGGGGGCKMSGSKAVMVAGDIDHDEHIFVSDYNSWAVGFGATEGYFISDLDMDRNVFVSDYNKWAANFGSTTSIGTGRCTFTDSRDGHVYNCVVIGTQTWMAENLAWLPAVSPSSDGSDTSPYYYVYGYEGNSVSAAKALATYGTYGVLYNWIAGTTACPSGWHSPSDEEWKTLEKSLGMSLSDADADTWRNSGTVGGKLKEAGTSHWSSPNAGATNTSGFRALPGGYRYYSGAYNDLGIGAYYWPSTESEWPTLARYRILYYDAVGVFKGYSYRSIGCSVRCLKN